MDHAPQFVAWASIAVFLGKPLWYTLALFIARKRLGAPVPGSVLVAGGMLRAALGFTFMLLMWATHWRLGVDLLHNTYARFAVLGVHGFACWLLTAKAVFRRTPWSKLSVVACLAELVSLLADAYLVLQINEIDAHFC
jgi:hypothetical protein